MKIQSSLRINFLNGFQSKQAGYCQIVEEVLSTFIDRRRQRTFKVTPRGG